MKHTKPTTEPSPSTLTNQKGTKHAQTSAPDPDLLPIPHPGETLLEDFMKPLSLTAYAVAKATKSTPITISMVCRGKRAVSVQLALRLARYFGTSARFWMNLQSDHDLKMAEREVGASIEQSVVPLAAA